LRLREAGPFARLTEHLEENCITGRVDGLFHLRSSNALESGYKPNFG
jgi:hypothetical protein